MSDWTHLHPILIHFPIALLVTGLLFDLAGRMREREAYRVVGKWNLYAGTVALAPPAAEEDHPAGTGHDHGGGSHDH